jgi:hypothetical protein
MTSDLIEDSSLGTGGATASVGRDVWVAPHSEQNLAPCGSAKPHEVHVIGASLVRTLG